MPVSVCFLRSRACKLNVGPDSPWVRVRDGWSGSIKIRERPDLESEGFTLWIDFGPYEDDRLVLLSLRDLIDQAIEQTTPERNREP